MTSSAGMKWQHYAAIAGGCAVAGGILYYLLSEESASVSEPTKEGGSAAVKRKIDVNEITKEELLGILQEIISSQNEMKQLMKQLTQELIKKEFTFDEVYEKVKKVQPADPLERHGISMADFDQLLDRYQNVESIHEAIGKIMGAPSGISVSLKVNSVKLEKIIEIHEFMLKALKSIVDEFQKDPRKNEYDMKTVTIAAQAMVGAKVESTYSLTSEDIEAAVMLHHQALAADQEFARINLQMQSTMSDLMGAHFTAPFG